MGTPLVRFDVEERFQRSGRPFPALATVTLQNDGTKGSRFLISEVVPTVVGPNDASAPGIAQVETSLLRFNEVMVFPHEFVIYAPGIYELAVYMTGYDKTTWWSNFATVFVDVEPFGVFNYNLNFPLG